MSELTKVAFEETITKLLTASPKNSSKGDPMKEWFWDAFSVKARVARITEDKQLGNRITEQFTYKDAVVVFVLEPAVNRESLVRKVCERQYVELTAVLIVGANGATPPYTYEHLLMRRTDAVTTWICENLGVNAEQISELGTAGVSCADRLQQISYGAPGTGKSHGVDEVAAKLPKEDVVRTTFHPDSDYSTFVGAYKPKMELVPRVAMDGTTVKKATYDAGIDADAKALLEVEKRISYEFVPQAFAKAYAQAWKRMATPGADGKIAPVMLVIEEINRGDCAKIFGDLFQLLDRRVKDDQQDATKKAGFSEYPVLADSDLADFIRRELTDAEKAAITNAGYGTVVAKEHLELMLPPNMYIWATMNTSDQSLFPMDSAFKRRWDWKYTPIKDEGRKWKIQVGGSEYDWWKFLKKVNAEVLHLTSSEDKQLGYFFVKPTDDVIDAEMFVNKVMFFLWNVVWKDCYTECEYLKNGDEYFTFRDFFDDEGKADAGNVNKVLAALKIEKWTAAVPTQSAVAAPGESANETSESTTESETSATAE